MRPMFTFLKKTILVVGLLSLSALVVGCASTSEGGSPSKVQLKDFVKPDPSSSSDTDDASSVAGAEQTAGGEQRIANAVLAPGAESPEEIASAANKEKEEARLGQTVGPPKPGTVVRRTGERIVVDSMIGQVNGRPIFANEVLDPVADELWAEARRLSLEAFRSKAFKTVQKRLEDVILNELFLSEAQIGLTKEQETGLLGFLRNLREELVGQGGGVRTQAEQRMQEEEGLTLDEKVDLEKNKMLIGHLMRSKISPHVVVSWRDIEREYKRKNERYNPQPKVVLGRIQVTTEGNQERIESIEKRLVSGESFMDVAKAEGMRNDGRWDSFLMGPEGISDIEIAAEFKQHLVGLEQGDSVGPFVRGSRTIWLHVIMLEQADVKSLFTAEVQTELRQELHARSFQREQKRYVDQLMQRGIYDDMMEMSNRVMDIVMVRFVPKG
ncbi:MAG: hypothetical protein P8J86_12790 [Phycisphaerales bacterium]|nr:hypothetical protein [Phycisphaerales bacterium]